MINEKQDAVIKNDVSPADHQVAPSTKIFGSEIIGAPQPALTAQSGIPTGTDAGTIANTITRVGEIEARLKNLGLLP